MRALPFYPFFFFEGGIFLVFFCFFFGGGEERGVGIHINVGGHVFACVAHNRDAKGGEGAASLYSLR